MFTLLERKSAGGKIGEQSGSAPQSRAGPVKNKMDPLPITVVIADDDPAFRRLLGRHLERLPHVQLIGEGVNGSEALDMVVTRRPRLLFIDIDMPGASGLEIASLVHEHHPGTAVIVVTLSDSEEVQAACLAQGVDGFMSKRRIQVELPITVDEVLGRSAARVPQGLAAPGLPLDRNRRADAGSSGEMKTQVLAGGQNLPGTFTSQPPVRLPDQETLRLVVHDHLVSIVESSRDSILSIDLGGTITSWNKGAQRLLGYAPVEVIGRSTKMLLPPERQDEESIILSRLKSGQNVESFETVRMAKDGRRVAVSVTMSPLKDGDGRIIGASKIFRDITERKALEEQLRQAQKMEAVAQLAAGVAHDFNNVLVAILMNLGLLQNNPSINEDTKESLREVEKHTVRATNLTRQLLLFSRQQAARIGPMEMNSLITDLLKMLRRLLGENIEISFEGASEGCWIKADAGMMEQIVMNLCINARDAMSQGGRLAIVTKTVEIPDAAAKLNPDARGGRFVCLTITDTGCGMDEKVLPRIFEPFYTTKEVGKGTGLGLATVYGIARQHEGWVEVQSELGKGSAFHVYIPAATPIGAFEIPDQDDAVKGGAETILLVEDELFVRRTIALSLRRLGYAVFEAGNAPEALNVWKEHKEKVSLLFTDTLMPGNMTGIDLATQLRNEKETLKIISSSGYRVDKPEINPAKGPPIVYLPKPYAPITLARTVRDCLDKG